MKEETLLSSWLDENYKSDLQIDEKVNLNLRPKRQVAVTGEIKKMLKKLLKKCWLHNFGNDEKERELIKRGQ